MSFFVPSTYARDLYEGYLWIYREFYSLRNIIRRLPEERSQWVPYLLFALVYRKFGRLTSKLAKFGSMRAIGLVARRLSYGIG